MNTLNKNKKTYSHEVEIRALLNDKQKNEFEIKLTNEGAKFKNKTHIIDIYFCPTEVRSFKEIEMQKIGSFSLRIRRETTNGKTKISINTKTITRDGDHNSWEEHEVEVSSFDETIAIFKKIGFKVFFTLEKYRSIYQLNDMTICLEDIIGLGPSIEVEIMIDKPNSLDAKQRIKDFLKNLGVADKQFTKKSITNMLMRDYAQF